MNRYCPKCKKSFDFNISKMSELDTLTCPECGLPIGKNSREPNDNEEQEEKTMNAFGNILSFFYIFYILLSGIGIGFYFLHWNMALYAVTGIVLSVYLIQMLIGWNTFSSGIFLIPAGAAVAYYFLKTIPGACLGILGVFAIRHIIRDIIIRFIFWVVEKLSRF